MSEGHEVTAHIACGPASLAPTPVARPGEESGEDMSRAPATLRVGFGRVGESRLPDCGTLHMSKV